ncbi:TipAS antibiotic-recognition domain-containing protein [Rhodococcus sp. HNM0569]|uniref:TipAS antibiotic-recognition domain-containing protein n=1 Tax=Rhodococcus sp. HNM0569 TaxID=2716340 RepID=UPI00146EB0A1|nr:MerR family transcriptional regulator [Rhodococcus sp. HNM0569]
MSGEQEWSISELAAASGVTSRTLRYYGEVGLLEPSRLGANGYRWYDASALVRLQRILLLRELGLRLDAIGEVLAGERDELDALGTHLELLEHEQRRLARRIESVRTTIGKRKSGERLMAEQSFDGFDHRRYKDEVTERWGADAWRAGDDWWSAKGEGEQADFRRASAALAADWAAAAADGAAADGERARALAGRHLAWLGGVPGTPRTDDGSLDPGYVRGLAQLYVDDERFAANYGGRDGARFVRDALLNYLS